MIIKQDKFTREEELQNKMLEDGIYKATVSEVYHKFHGDLHWSASVLYWKFLVEEPKKRSVYGIVGLTGSDSISFEPGSKLSRWITSCGIELNSNEELDTNSLISKLVKIQVVNNKVVHVLPLN